MAKARQLRHVRKGEPVTAEAFNELVDVCRMFNRISGSPPIHVSYAESGINVGLKANIPRIDLLELDEDIEAGKLDKEATKLVRDFAASSGDADQFLPTTETLARCMDHMRSVWLQGTRSLGLWLPNADQRIMVPCFNWHVVQIIDADLTSGSSTSAKILTPLSGSLADTTGPLEITVNDIGSGSTTPIGTRCVVLQHPVGGKWWVVPNAGAATPTPHCTVDFKVKTAPFTVSDSTFSAEVTDVVGDALTTIGATITVENPVGNVTSYMFSGQVDDRGWAQYTGHATAWRCRGLECRP